MPTATEAAGPWPDVAAHVDQDGEVDAACCDAADTDTTNAPEPANANASAEHDDGLEMLRPLERRWVSKKFGPILAKRRENQNTQPIGGPDLLVFPTGQGTEDAVALGMLYLCSDTTYCKGRNKGRHLVFEIFAEKGKSYWVWLNNKSSRSKRVFWDDKKGREADVWDCSLLLTAFTASEWLHGRNLESQLEAGLQRLSNHAGTSAAPYGGQTVALCIATMNRLWQLRRALPLNLIHCWPHREWTKIHIVDFGSSDGTLDFLLSRCRSAIDCGLLSVYSSDELPFWHASIAKNTVHVCAGEDILVNVDSDNLVGPDFPVSVAKKFQEGFTILQYEDGEGTCGRIASTREDFMRIRGYDEDAFPMGAQDTDLVQRLKELPKARFRKVRDLSLSQAIPNSIDMKVACCSSIYWNLRWGRMDTMNKNIFRWRREAGQIARNPGKTNIGVKASRVENNRPGLVRDAPARAV